MARRPSAARLLDVCAALVLPGIALRSAVWLHDASLDPPRNWFIEDIYYPSWMRLDGLVMGVMLATLQVYRPQLWSRLQAYSLYLSHKLAFHAVQVALAPSIGSSGLLRFAVYGVAALALGAALYGLVERPCLRWRERQSAAGPWLQAASRS